MAQTAVTGFTETFVQTDPFYRGTYKATVSRTATGSGAVTAGDTFQITSLTLSLD